ncbi:MAG TPA: diguanylate cyclase [Vulgatibacter sp.]
MGERIAVVAGSPFRRTALADALAELGLPTLKMEPGDQPVAAREVILDLSEATPEQAEHAVRRCATMGPVIVVGGRADIAALEAGVRAGAFDLAIDPDPAELGTRLRLAARRQGAGGQASALPSRVRTGRTRVLVVEDDRDARELLCDLLADEHEVLGAADAEEGLERARRDAPDVILMDLYLPGMDGFAAARALQEDSRTAAIPVLFLSAEADEKTRVQGLQLGAADFVVKPFSAVELLARVDKALRAARQGEHLRALAETDALTGLPNFRALLARLDEEIKRADRYRHPLSLVMVDLDTLKAINDRLGHAGGNRAIIALGQAITSQLRETDFAARYGGDEFVLVLPHAVSAQAAGLAERLRHAMRSILLDPEGTAIRGSFGVASFRPGTGTSPDGLLRAADTALYRAKREGRDRVRIAEEEDAPRHDAGAVWP